MASFFSKLGSLFSGGAGGGQENEQAVKSIVHEDCIIFAEPVKEGAQYRLQGRIEKEVGEETLVRTFIRADLFASQDEAIEWSLKKGKQIVDQNGRSLFSDGEKHRTA
ncbi:HlyU family transcriptional regulator [Martelella sp. AD-3]|uniref:HlyU family transcriptional regulator n=1 Tax=Martelella sp. AD-3 TaxID=686597 RepID=UPI000465F6AD|nr:HlyU family transcriptional regulator [Martelella sp. AD-3]AMM83978.1 transcriptional activator HlyU [Martelella sp. AD-3]MAM09823.1 transcriptional activator HlyU [Rhizobiaceae bacterium]|tara:strand:+ start:270 stop:593 length:324 start_codon:yes stop_codon:yes gene_type:complete